MQYEKCGQEALEAFVAARSSSRTSKSCSIFNGILEYCSQKKSPHNTCDAIRHTRTTRDMRTRRAEQEREMYADEALWWARSSPASPVRALNRQRHKRQIFTTRVSAVGESAGD